MLAELPASNSHELMQDILREEVESAVGNLKSRNRGRHQAIIIIMLEIVQARGMFSRNVAHAVQQNLPGKEVCNRLEEGHLVQIHTVRKVMMFS